MFWSWENMFWNNKEKHVLVLGMIKKSMIWCLNLIPLMQEFVIENPKGLFSNTFFTSQYFCLYQFNGKLFCAKLKLDFLVIFQKWPKFTRLLLTDLKHRFFKVYFSIAFSKYWEGVMRCVTLIGGID